jgi:RNA polymerase sigma-70 factor, ECF subfamily
MPESAGSGGDCPDGELIERFVGGDASSFDTLVRRHERALLGFLVRMVRDEALAEDLFQEAFLRIMEALPGYRERGRFRSWLFSVARNIALDALRRRTFERRLFADSPSKHPDGGEAPVAELFVAPDSGPDDRVEEIERSRVLDRAIAGLPAEQREVLTLRLEGELTFREIAEITGVSINTALGRMRYATIALRRRLQALEGEEST